MKQPKTKNEQRATMPVFAQCCIVIFCLWHMFAVLVFAIPRESRDSFSMNVRAVLLPVVTPYMYTTSQWQLWNVFAPDPLQRITLYRVEEQTADGWSVVDTIKPGSYAWWRHANYFKYTENVLGSSNEGAQAQFLIQECTQRNIAPHTLLRLSQYSSTIPTPPHPGSMAFWNAWTTEWEQFVLVTASCPSSL